MPGGAHAAGQLAAALEAALGALRRRQVLAAELLAAGAAAAEREAAAAAALRRVQQCAHTLHQALLMYIYFCMCRAYWKSYIPSDKASPEPRISIMSRAVCTHMCLHDVSEQNGMPVPDWLPAQPGHALPWCLLSCL